MWMIEAWIGPFSQVIFCSVSISFSILFHAVMMFGYNWKQSMIQRNGRLIFFVTWKYYVERHWPLTNLFRLWQAGFPLSFPDGALHHNLLHQNSLWAPIHRASLEYAQTIKLPLIVVLYVYCAATLSVSPAIEYCHYTIFRNICLKQKEPYSK